MKANEQVKKSVESIYSGYLNYINDWINVAFSAACPNERVYESVKSLVHEELFKDYDEQIKILIEVDNPLRMNNQFNSIVGRIKRVAETSIDIDKQPALKILLTNTIWKNAKSVIDELNKLSLDKVSTG